MIPKLEQPRRLPMPDQVDYGQAMPDRDLLIGMLKEVHMKGSLCRSRKLKMLSLGFTMYSHAG